MYDGVVRYLGCIAVQKSMTTLNKEYRSEVAKESIKRLCRANSINKDPEDITQSESFDKVLGEPNLKHKGTDVRLYVTSSHLNVITKATNTTIVKHEMPNVSIAYGDEKTIDFLAYVGKDAEFGRACHVFQCDDRTGKAILSRIRSVFEERRQKIFDQTSPKTSPRFNHTGITNLFHSSNIHDTSFDNLPNRLNNHENEHEETSDLIAKTREYLKKEPWFHGSYLSREESETRLKQDGDFLVRESMLDPGHFVLSVMHEGTKLHLLFDSVGQVKTKEMTFDDISHLIRFHHDKGHPIVAENRFVRLRNGVLPNTRSRPVS